MVGFPSVPSLAALPVDPLVVPGVPGAPELIVVLLVAVLLFGLPLVLVAGAYVYLRRDRSLEELERRIAELEADRAAGGAETDQPDERPPNDGSDRPER